jgi:hypothetical protein
MCRLFFKKNCLYLKNKTFIIKVKLLPLYVKGFGYLSSRIKGNQYYLRFVLPKPQSLHYNHSRKALFYWGNAG